MKCPKCRRYMQRIEYGGIEIDRCTHCYGMWFDNFELEKLQKISGSEIIDIGDAELGQEYSQKSRYFCPKCSPESLMQAETDERQAHIAYERCPNCQGVYFDAGEFRDYKELTLSEFFKSIFGKKR